MKFLIVISGPTASGKTTLGIELAKYFDTIVLSADSRQFYREMSIGTAKPTPQEQAEVPHFFINNKSIREDYTVGDYEKDALTLLDVCFKSKDIAVMVGGSGLFIEAVINGLNFFPEVPPEIREDLIQTLENKGITPLQEELKLVDPEYYEVVDLQNGHRLIRALEVYRASGKPFSFFRNIPKPKRAFIPIVIITELDRTTLYKRINHRVDAMLGEGLVQEARELYPYKTCNALQTVGYQELFDFFDKKIPFEEAIRLIKRNSRRYAKRQLTWFRNRSGVHFFSPTDKKAIIQFIESEMNRLNDTQD